jgi:hypothetical protein
VSAGRAAFRRLPCPAPRRALRPALLAAVSLLALCACAGAPRPESAAEARVTGSLSLEFPDGFLGLPARTIRSPILLHFRNTVRGTRFLRSTADGRFAFPAAGGEELLLVRYEYSLSGPDFSCYLNDGIGISFRPQPGETLDLGHIRIRYTGPRPSDRVSFARSTTVEEEDLAIEGPGSRFGLHRLRQTWWRYERELEILDARVNDFLQANRVSRVVSVSDSCTATESGATIGIIRVVAYEAP